jgi:hypothetical protein
VPYHIASVQQRFGGTQVGQRRDFRWQDPVVPATRNSSLNRPEVHSANPRPQVRGMERQNPRRDGRPEGRISANPGAAARPEFHGPVIRSPVAAAPQFGAGRGQPGNRAAPSAPRAHGEGHR